MNASKNATTIRRGIIAISLCAIAAAFMLTNSGQKLLARGASLLTPTVAQSAIMPAEDPAASFRNALEAEIYLPHEVDLTAGSDYIAPEALQEQAQASADLTAMLGGQGGQCNFRDHVCM